jgi:hypothetical protein
MFNGLFETGGAILLSTVIAYDDNSRLDNIYVIRTEYDSIFKCEVEKEGLEMVTQEYTFLKNVKQTFPALDKDGLALLKNVCVEENVDESK